MPGARIIPFPPRWQKPPPLSRAVERLIEACAGERARLKAARTQALRRSRLRALWQHLAD